MSLELQLSTMHLPIGSLDAYIQRVNQIPMLSAEEEKTFARNFRENGDVESARQLVLAHLRYVVRVARGYLGYGLPLGDLIQEGNVGLMKAVKRFDPEMGVRLVSFAVHWIKAEIHEFVIQNWRIVKIATTKAQRKLFFNIRNMKKRLGWFSVEEVDAVAKDLNVTRSDVLEMEKRLNAMDMSFDPQEAEDEQAHQYSPAAFLPDSSNDPALLLEEENSFNHSNLELHNAIESLDERSQDILRQRWLNSEKTATLHTLAEKYGISAERVRQLEKNAMSKLRKKMQVLQ